MWTRRQFSTLLSAALATGCTRSGRSASGDLRADAEGLLDLLPGLSYTILQQVGDRMTDGFMVPGKPDGMGCFVIDEQWVLVRNHELGPFDAAGPSTVPLPEAFDATDLGSVTRLVVDPATLEVQSSNLVLTGTRRNCGGGVTPWGWLTCEESTSEGHGWVFLCDPTASSVQPPVQVPGFGQFNHEAAVVDPATGITWLTEDEWDGCLYRHVPEDPAAPFGPGRLQVAALPETAAPTASWEVGQGSQVTWVDVPDGSTLLRTRAVDAGGATFARGEGAWFVDGELVFTATSGGPVGAGQVFRLTVADDRLEAIAVSSDRDRFDSPDNLCLDDRGNVFITEDSPWPCVLHVLLPDGRLIALGRTVNDGDELAGVCVEPDGDVLFVNLMRSGVTLAIRGVRQVVEAL